MGWQVRGRRSSEANDVGGASRSLPSSSSFVAGCLARSRTMLGPSPSTTDRTNDTTTLDDGDDDSESLEIPYSVHNGKPWYPSKYRAAPTRALVQLVSIDRRWLMDNRNTTPRHDPTLEARVADLLARRADPNGPGQLLSSPCHGGTPLVYSCLRDDAALVRLLLEARADPSLRALIVMPPYGRHMTLFDYTPLSISIGRRNVDAVSMLLDAKADISCVRGLALALALSLSLCVCVCVCARAP